MGVSRSDYSRVENGWLRPSASFKEKAADALGEPVHDLFPELWFLAGQTPQGRHLAGPGGRTLAFTSENRARAAVSKLESHGRAGLELFGPAPMAFYAVVRGEDEEELVRSLLVDPTPDQLEAQQVLKNEDPALEPGLETTSVGMSDGYGSG